MAIHHETVLTLVHTSMVILTFITITLMVAFDGGLCISFAAERENQQRNWLLMATALLPSLRPDFNSARSSSSASSSSSEHSLTMGNSQSSPPSRVSLISS